MPHNLIGQTGTLATLFPIIVGTVAVLAANAVLAVVGDRKLKERYGYVA